MSPHSLTMHILYIPLASPRGVLSLNYSGRRSIEFGVVSFIALVFSMDHVRNNENLII